MSFLKEHLDKMIWFLVGWTASLMFYNLMP